MKADLYRRLSFLGSFVLLMAVLAVGCNNPFAPELGNPASSLWTDQVTVGGLLQNFRNAYNYADSLHYADCLADDFTFFYFDPDENRFDQWYRETDLTTTGRLFRHFQSIRLIWGSLPLEVEDFSQVDSLLDFQVPFNLTLNDLAPLYGFAHFSVYRPAGDRFQIVVWRDDF
ncbi:hypothetical protein AMJ86_09295 [bacterium SM23_57]|nr:MAG: hypothetical protein AMJ86_09295 [bacterium SM23_57]